VFFHSGKPTFGSRTAPRRLFISPWSAFRSSTSTPVPIGTSGGMTTPPPAGCWLPGEELDAPMPPPAGAVASSGGRELGKSNWSVQFLSSSVPQLPRGEELGKSNWSVQFLSSSVPQLPRGEEVGKSNWSVTQALHQGELVLVRRSHQGRPVGRHGPTSTANRCFSPRV